MNYNNIVIIIGHLIILYIQCADNMEDFDNMEDVEKGRTRMTQNQKSLLIVSIVDDFKCFFGKHVGNTGNHNRNERWEELTAQLNELGPPKKTVDGWKESWKEIKRAAKARHLKCKKSQQQTGGGKRVKPLTDLEEKVLSVSGDYTLSGGKRHCNSFTEFEYSNLTRPRYPQPSTSSADASSCMVNPTTPPQPAPSPHTSPRHSPHKSPHNSIPPSSFTPPPIPKPPPSPPRPFTPYVYSPLPFFQEHTTTDPPFITGNRSKNEQTLEVSLAVAEATIERLKIEMARDAARIKWLEGTIDKLISGKTKYKK